MNGVEVDFGTDKYNQPKKLSLKESILQIIINALFMKPGNIPSKPYDGVYIQQYVYKSEDKIDAERIVNDLRRTCGTNLIGSYLSDISFNVIEMEYGQRGFLLVISLDIPQEGDQKLAIGVIKQNDYINYNYEFIEGGND